MIWESFVIKKLYGYRCEGDWIQLQGHDHPCLRGIFLEGNASLSGTCRTDTRF